MNFEQVDRFDDGVVRDREAWLALPNQAALDELTRQHAVQRRAVRSERVGVFCTSLGVLTLTASAMLYGYNTMPEADLELDQNTSEQPVPDSEYTTAYEPELLTAEAIPLATANAASLAVEQSCTSGDAQFGAYTGGGLYEHDDRLYIGSVAGVTPPSDLDTDGDIDCEVTAHLHGVTPELTVSNVADVINPALTTMVSRGAQEFFVPVPEERLAEIQTGIEQGWLEPLSIQAISENNDTFTSTPVELVMPDTGQPGSPMVMEGAMPIVVEGDMQTQPQGNFVFSAPETSQDLCALRIGTPVFDRSDDAMKVAGMLSDAQAYAPGSCSGLATAVAFDKNTIAGLEN